MAGRIVTFEEKKQQVMEKARAYLLSRDLTREVTRSDLRAFARLIKVDGLAEALWEWIAAAGWAKWDTESDTLRLDMGKLRDGN